MTRGQWDRYGTRRQFYAYMMSNASMTLYTGVTNDVIRRSQQHNDGDCDFTRRYHFDRLVYFESFDRIVDAIAREKQIKGMTRAKKIALVKSVNPRWRDLSSP
jgi:putative endonuclease